MFKDLFEVLFYIQENDVKFFDICFIDFFGVQQYFNIFVVMVDEVFFMDGQLFDGFFIWGFVSIYEFDMQFILDVIMVYIDFFCEVSIFVMLFDIYNLCIGEIYLKDLCQVVKKVEKYLVLIGIVDIVFFVFEVEFYIFDDVCYFVIVGESFYKVDFEEVVWNIGCEEEGGNFVNKILYKGGYFFVSLVDKIVDLCDDIIFKFIEVGFIFECLYYEVGIVGQQEINYCFDIMVYVVDDILKFKYIVKNIVNEWGKVVIFMLKLFYGDNGFGMYMYQLLWNDGKLLFYDEVGYGQFSDIVCWYIGGILVYVLVLFVFINLMLNSYYCLVKGFEVLVNLVYLVGNWFVVICILIMGLNLKVKCIEFCVFDVLGNLYFVFVVQFMVGFDGIKNCIELYELVDKDFYELLFEEVKNILQVLNLLLDLFEVFCIDYQFFFEGGVFIEEFIEIWIFYKYENEILLIVQCLYLFEYELYFGV